jgi:DNA-binding transcriptional ArsR family regulator
MFRRSPTPTDNVLELDDEETERVLTALSAESARQIRSALNEEPATVSELADRTGLTPQNVSYHLGKLVDADLVRSDGTSGTGGNEATRYAAGRDVVVSTEHGAAHRRPRLGIVGLAFAVVLVSICLHPLVVPSDDIVAMVLSGLHDPGVLF